MTRNRYRYRYRYLGFNLLLAISLFILLPFPFDFASAGEYFIQPGENIITISVKNLDYSIGPVTVKVTIANEPAWLSISPKEKVFPDIQPEEVREFDFSLNATCDLSTLTTISGEATFLYEAQTDGVIESIREREHKFIIDKSVGFVANKEADTVTVVNLNPCANIGKSLAQLSVGETPFGVAVRMDGKRIYVTNAKGGSLSVIDLQFDPDDPSPTFGEAKEIKISLGEGFTPNLIAITPDNSRAYIADQSQGLIKIINLMYWTDFGDGFTMRSGREYAPHEYIRDIPIVGGPGVRGDKIEAMAIDPAGRRLWVVVRDGLNFEANGGCVAVVDIEQVVMRNPSWPKFHSIIDVIDLQRMDKGPLNEPSGIAFTPDGDLAYITGEGTTGFITEIANWEDGSGGIVVIDPQAVYDPSIEQAGEQAGDKVIDYIAPHVLGSQASLSFITWPQVDFFPFMGFGGGVGSGIIFGMQEVYNTLSSMYNNIIYEFPVDIDGAESIAISPDGTRAYITFFNTNNFGLIDLHPSTEAAGIHWGNPPPDNDIYAASEAILPEINPEAYYNPAAFRFPNEITFSKDGHYVMISNRSNEEDLLEIVDDIDMDVILSNVSRDDLMEKPINEFPAGDVSIYGDLIRYVRSVGGIDDPEGIAMTPGYDNDGDSKDGGASNLVEAKNRFNCLLSLPGNLSHGSLISSYDGNLLSPSLFNPVALSESEGRPYGDLLNNYNEETHIDTMPGKLSNGVLLPTEGLGYRHEFGQDPYNSDNAGALALINLLEDIGREWLLRHPEGPRLVYLDLSRPGGGQFQDKLQDMNGQDTVQRHAAHQNGLDVNIRYLRKDKSENPFDFVESNITGKERDNTIENLTEYDPELSSELINMFLADERVTRVVVDPRVIERAKDAGLSISTSDKLISRGDINDPESRRDYDDHFGVRVGQKNLPPVADAGTDQTINEGESFKLDGSSSFDPDDKRKDPNDPQTITFKWIQKDGPSAGITEEVAENPIIFLGCPKNEDTSKAHKFMVFGLTVFDGEFESQEDEVIISINRKPIAKAGEDQTIEGGREQEITLDGSGSYDPDGDLITDYIWDPDDEETRLILGDPDLSGDKPSFPAPDTAATLTFTLTVKDSYGATSETDTVVITVK